MSSDNFLANAVNSFSGSRANIIFDYDSTIARVPIDWTTARDACRAHLNKHLTRLVIKPDLRMDEMEHLALLAYPDESELIFACRKKIESEASGMHEPISGTVRYIERDLSRTFYVLSNNLRSTVIAGLRQFNLLSRFYRVIGIDDIGAPKPSMRALQFLCEQDSQIADKAIFVGDSERTDGKFCECAGIPFINISSKKIRAIEKNG